jgi:hypothetical protein
LGQGLEGALKVECAHELYQDIYFEIQDNSRLNEVSIPAWNDYDGRTKEEVLALCARIILRAEEKRIRLADRDRVLAVGTGLLRNPELFYGARWSHYYAARLARRLLLDVHDWCSRNVYYRPHEVASFAFQEDMRVDTYAEDQRTAVTVLEQDGMLLKTPHLLRGGYPGADSGTAPLYYGEFGELLTLIPTEKLLCYAEELLNIQGWLIDFTKEDKEPGHGADE